MKRVLMLFMFLILIPNVIWADDVIPSNIYKNFDYVIDSYNIDIVVNENNTFDIKEEIEVYFNVDRHGIYRTLPLRTNRNNRVKISDLDVNNEYTLSRSNGSYIIKIGNSSYVFSGKEDYLISYNYNIGEDPLKDSDEFYFNIIGNEWDTVIGNISFTITMPKEFDSSKISFYSGKVGNTSNNVSYSVLGNVISGSYNGIINPNESVTVKIELEEGYFKGEAFPISPYYNLMFILPMVGIVMSFILWLIYGKDDIVVETLNFYPPEGVDSLEVGYLYKGYADNKDVVSLLIYLANKGYIKIIDLDKEGFKIIKLKDYDGNNINEKMFVEGLFKDELCSNGVIYVTDVDLYDSFYVTMDNILGNINNTDNKNLIFDKKSRSMSIFVMLFIIISLVTTFGVPTLDYVGVCNEFYITMFFVLFFSLCCGVFLSKKYRLSVKILSMLCVLIFSLLFFSFLPISSAIVDEVKYLIGFIYGIVCVIIMVILYKLMPKRTKYGNDMLGNIRGFKTFLETVEKDKLESMVSSNPTYFYDILPYTYVLGISDVWIEKFESISFSEPDWYDGSSSFDFHSFSNFMDSTMNSANDAMTSTPYSGNDFSGSSGGGSGGGGGGSW